MSSPIFSYAGGHLDRAAIERKNPEWLKQVLAHDSRRVVPLWRNRNLIAGNNDAQPKPSPVILESDAAREVLDLATESVLLGLDETGPVVAVDLPRERVWSDVP